MIDHTAVRLRAETLITPGIAAWDQKAKPFNDQVTEAVKHLLQTSEEFQALVLSTKNSETVEGTMLDDFVAAARMLREASLPHSPIRDAKTATLRRVMGVALRRMNMGRKQLLISDMAAE